MSKKLTIEEMHQLAKNKNGRCLSKEYINSKTKLEWECEQKHTFWAKSNDVKNGHWCPECAGKRISIQDMQNLAFERGGWCLSPEYMGTHVKLWWQCGEGHVWDATPHNLKSGKYWCPYCAGYVKYTIEDMQKIAYERGGWCLSDTYFGSNVKLWWQCGEGHVWYAKPGRIVQKRWCKKCGYIKSAKKRVKHSIWDMQKIAYERGGWCLSPDYINSKIDIWWQCGEGHIWNATPYEIMRGTWCPICSSGLSERICRMYFQIIFGYSFPKYRPKWLVNNLGNRLELDGYCKPLNLAFEYCGKQHYYFSKYFHKNREKFLKLKKNDLIKKKLCKKNNVKLIIIDYKIDYSDIQNYIINECIINNVELPEKIEYIDFRKLDVYFNKKLIEMQKIAIERGGWCLSSEYIDSNTKLWWQCGEGHVWDSKPYLIKNGSWCPYCAGNIKYSIEMMQKIALKRGGWCLSNQYYNVFTRLWWQCGEGHVWPTPPQSIIGGSWCPYCSGCAKGTIEEMQQLALSRGGWCLSPEYVSTMSKLWWQCGEGHVWDAAPDSIKRGGWCPYCAGKVKHTIEDMQKFALERDGWCLSSIYYSNHTKLWWQCGEGHIWNATPTNVIHNDSWCPYCSGCAKGTIEEMQQLALSRGGWCLSPEYVSTMSKLWWQCGEGHVWDATPNSLKSKKSWCPYCAGKVKLTIEDMQKLAFKRGGWCLSQKYYNIDTKLWWQCGEGHIWNATPTNVIHNDSWCPICYKINRKKGLTKYNRNYKKFPHKHRF